jgi:hypothetical protein
MPASIPRKTILWNGRTAYQYIKPNRPLGSKNAVWRSVHCRSPVLWTRKSSSASPGNRISARNERQRSRSNPTTLQKSRASPNLKVFGFRLPRRRPGPPTRRSSQPRNFQKGFAYHPFLPPTRHTARKAAHARASTAASRTYERRCHRTSPDRPASARPSTNSFLPSGLQGMFARA